eukprot:1532145-Amphidinium_carterae.1
MDALLGSEDEEQAPNKMLLIAGGWKTWRLTASTMVTLTIIDRSRGFEWKEPAGSQAVTRLTGCQAKSLCLRILSRVRRRIES